MPQEVHDVLRRYLPEPGLSYRVVHRIAGLGSLGRQRFVALAQWRGGSIAREAKALVPSAWTWQQPTPSEEIFYEKALTTAVRMVDPWVHLAGRWIVRRLSPDCRRIELESLPEDRNELKLLAAMGREMANIHLGSGPAAKDGDRRRSGKRDRKWLRKAAQAMADSVRDDWRQWRKAGMKAKHASMKIPTGGLSRTERSDRLQVADQHTGRADTPGSTASSINNKGSRLPRSAYRLSLRKT